MKTVWIIIVIVVILVAGYLGRHKIKAMFAGSPTPAPVITTATTPPAASPATASASALTTTKTGSKGDYLADTKGMTLYIFDKDKPGVSNCNGSCASIWPPFKVSAKSASLPAGFSVFTRADGSEQYAYKDMPLYYYAKDTKAGDTLGDGVNGTWHLAKP